MCDIFNRMLVLLYYRWSSCWPANTDWLCHVTREREKNPY